MIPYSLKLGKCEFSWLVDIVQCVANWCLNQPEQEEW
jgi:hypothetical protein